MVQGMEDILIRFGNCCHPVPGDSITGYITHGQGVTVHRSSCINALKMDPERRIDVAWKTGENEMFPASLTVSGYDQVGLLADISTAISKANANINDVHLEHRDNNIVLVHFTIIVNNIEHLEKVIASLKNVPVLSDVKRV